MSKGVPWTETELAALHEQTAAGLRWEAMNTGHTADANQQMAAKKGWATRRKGPKPGAAMEAACIDIQLRRSNERFVRAFQRVARG